MKQRGRKSAASLATVSVLPVRLIEPPGDLTAPEAEVWARIVVTKPGDWWDAASTPLLAQFCRATVQAEAVAELVRQTLAALATPDGDLDTYKDLRKIQAALSAELTSLATKMRLTQQSRYNAKNSDTASRRGSGRKPWQQHDVIDAS